MRHRADIVPCVASMLGGLRGATPAFVAAIVTILTGTQAGTQPATEFYRGKQIRLITGSDVGGAYDAYSRLIAKYMTKFIPGEPSFLPQNMPGAGSMTALNHVANVAPRDGTVIAGIHADTVLAPLFNPEKAKFDSRRLNWLGAPVTMSYVIAIWHTAPVQSLDQIFQKELIVAAAGGNSVTLPVLTNALLGTKFKIVRGYKSSAAALLALERGEAEGIAGHAVGFLKLVATSNLRDGKLRIIGSYALRPNPDLPGIPLVTDYAKTIEQKEALALILAEQDFGWPYVMAQDVPADRVQVMRDAFDATMKDPGFLAEAAKAGLEIRPTRGAQQSALIEQAFETPKGIVEQVRRIVGE